MKVNILKRHSKLLLLVLLISPEVFAQTLSLQQSIELANKNNYQLKINRLETEGQRLLIKTARELPKTNLDLQLGRTQTYYTNDYIVGLTQQFSHPKLYQAQADLQKSHVEASLKNEALNKNELIGRIKQIYYELFYYQQQRRILTQQDSVYRSTQQIAEARYKTGESNALEKTNAELRLQEISNRMRVLDKDEETAYKNFKLLLNSTQDFKLDFTIPLKKDTAFISNAHLFSENPLLSVFEQQSVVSQKQTNVEKQKLKPDFRVGLINQSIEHRLNQMVVSAGIGLPIFTKAQKARVEAAKVNEKIAESNLQSIDFQLNTQLSVLKTTYQKHKNSLNYYESFALPQSELMIKSAVRGYQTGEIDYVELIQNNQQAWQIKDNYLLTILNFNQTIIQIETLLGIE